MGEPLNINGVQLLLNISIGISVFPDDNDNAELLLRNADAAMYRAKSNGRNNYQYYSPELTAQAEELIQIGHDIGQALINDEFVVYYQPQIGKNKMTMIGAEALIRWQHPVKGWIMPNSFIPIAEKTGQITLIDKWVLKKVAQFIVASEKRNIEIPRISVNFSGKDFNRDPLSESISTIKDDAGCAADRIEIEITESQLMDHPEQCIEELQKLRSMGIDVAIDDFGTGYSSLSYLKKLPIGKLKIDQSFVRDVITDKNDRSIIKAIIALGKSLDIELIAEGVETDEQESFLIAEGCNQLQGYLYSKPLAEKDFIGFLNHYERPRREYPESISTGSVI